MLGNLEWNQEQSKKGCDGFRFILPYFILLKTKITYKNSKKKKAFAGLYVG